MSIMGSLSFYVVVSIIVIFVFTKAFDSKSFL